jgi:solute carrier family 25 (mitochondrial citrate transporter), member 1
MGLDSSSIIAGGIVGSAEALTTWPMEFMKIQMQLKQNEQKMPKLHSALYRQVTTSGFGSLYKGIIPILATGIPRNAIRFQTFEIAKKTLDNNKQNPLNAMFAGMIAGSVESAIIGIPSETLKTAMIEKNMKTRQVIKHQYQNYGLGGFYQGAFATIMRNAITQGTRFMGYTTYKTILGKFNDNPSRIHNLIGGGFAGFCSVYGSQPFDIIKTRKQASLTAHESIPNIVRDIYKELSLQGFWKGSVPRLSRVIPGQCITFFLYGEIVAWIRSFGSSEIRHC